MRDILHVGKILTPHGLRGEVKMLALTDSNDRFKQLKNCFLVTQDEKSRTPALVESVRFTGKQVILKLQGVDSREQAGTLKSLFVSVDRKNAVSLPADRWFISDLLNCEVYDQERGLLGLVADVLQPSAHDVYIIRKQGRPDLLIPVLKSILKKVDVENKRIEVLLPAGLYEIYRTGETDNAL